VTISFSKITILHFVGRLIVFRLSEKKKVLTLFTLPGAEQLHGIIRCEK
jgi:hypothetical protein